MFVGSREGSQQTLLEYRKEVSAFSCHILIDPCRFFRMGFLGCWARWWSSKWLHFLFACQTGSACIFLPVIDSSRFLREEVSRDTEHYGEAINVITVCFARQTGSALIFLHVIDRFTLFSQGGGFSRCGTPWWSQKCHCFLFWTVQINQLQAGKWWHFLFGEQNRK